MEILVKPVSFIGAKGLFGVLLFKGEKLPTEFSDYSKMIKKEDFEGSEGQVFPLSANDSLRLLFIGLGEEKDLSSDSFRKAAGSFIRYSKSHGFTSGELLLPQKLAKQDFVQSLAEGAVLAEYKFTKFKTKKEKEEVVFKQLTIGAAHGLSNYAKKGQLLAECQNYVREIDEHPANMVTPQRFVELAKTLSKEQKLDLTIFGKDQLKKMGMNGILAVNQGSALPPVLVVIEYNKSKKNLPLYCIVGKGITFDSGGISLKPSKGMHEMKYDKTGAIVVLGAMQAVSKLGLPIRLIGLMPVTENMPSGSAQKPGDIIRAYNGKTIEVLNTDAEGRLILADALSYAIEKKPEAIIDLATLTGAIITCLGPHAAGLFSNDDKLSETISRAGYETYERVWRLPIWKEYSEMIKSDFADIKNMGSDLGEASSITASKFLQEFVGETKWAHLDIAGVDLIRGSHPYLERGASGFGVRLLVNTLEKLAKR